MNSTNENQHFISRVLLKQFKKPGKPLFSYEIESGNWRATSLDNAFSANGYNQWIVNGVPENSFEACFSQVETHLPKVFKALADAATRKTTVLDPKIYDNMCKYCAMLRLSSPPAKASAVVNTVLLLNFELEKDSPSLWRFLQIPDDMIDRFRHEHSLGRRVIVECDNPIQWAFRVNYSRSCDFTFGEFLRSDWTISQAPFDLPISDIGIIPICYTDLKANHYMLPIGPRLLLECVHYFDQSRNSREPNVKSRVLPDESVEYYYDTICQSAVSQIICGAADPSIPQRLARRGADQNNVRFHQISNLRQVTDSGLSNSNGNFTLRAVSQQEYVSFIHSFVKPSASGLS